MLFECLDLLVPQSSDRESWLCHPSRKELTQHLKDAWASDSSASTASVAMPESIVHISVAACDRLLLLYDSKPQLRHVLRLLKDDINKQ